MSNRLQELSTNSYEIAKSKGWWDKPRTVAALTLLMQSEISEALEDFRAGKKINEVWYEDVRVKAPPCSCGVAHGEGCEVHHFIMPDGHCSCYVTHKKPCGIPSELADVVIRIADFCGHHKLRLEPMELLDKDQDFTDALAFATLNISNAFIALYASGGVGADTSLNRAAQIIFDLAERNGIDLWGVIEEKAEFNRKRSMRHGGKAI